MRWIALVCAALAAFALVIWLAFDALPDLFTPGPQEDFSLAEEQNARSDVRTSVLTLLGGLTLAAGAFLTARSVSTARESNDIARAGQVTDRFTKAVEQLADKDSLAVRLGGIYALEQIARDSPPNREPIKQLLSALVRERAPRAATPEEPVPADVQVALTVLGRREPAPLHTGGWLDLRGLRLCEVDLSNAHLDGVDLSGSNLTLAKMWGIKKQTEPMVDGTPASSQILLRNCTLHRATLVMADLSGGDLQEANLTAADCRRANLSRADMHKADLRSAQLAGADLSGANLEDADLSEALNLDSAKVDNIKFNAGTKWPAGFERPTLGTDVPAQADSTS